MVAGQRLHGTLQARPAQVFADKEDGLLLPVPAAYDVPMFKTCKVHRDFHIEIGRALYSIPKDYIGQYVDVRADSMLVKVFHRGQVIKVCPRQRPGGRWTDRDDLPQEKTAYAMRDLDRLIAGARRHGANVGVYAERLLDDPMPWTRMRMIYRLFGLVRRYGPDPVDAACGRTLDVDVVSVTKIASMLDKATETATITVPAPRSGATARFARDPRRVRHPPRSAGSRPATTPQIRPPPTGTGEPMPRTRRAAAAPNDTISPELKQTLRTLKLGKMLDTLPERLALARTQQLPYVDFLELLLADEVSRRDTNSAIAAGPLCRPRRRPSA